MGNIPSFPKIFQVGNDYIPDLFKDQVEITEKIDGSQFNFGLTADRRIVFRSKGQEMFFDAYQKMFQKAVDTVHDLEAQILELTPDTGFLEWYKKRLAERAFAGSPA